METWLNASDIVRKYPKSFIGVRWVATILDLIVWVLLIFSMPRLIENKFIQNWSIFIIFLCYYILLEGLTGYTFGKFIMRIRVVKKDFADPGIVKAFIRTLLRIIEVNPILLGGVPAGISALITKDKKRIGDILANTYVLYAKDVKKYKDSNNVCTNVGSEVVRGE